MVRERRVIDIDPSGLRVDDYCPNCNAQPRETVPAPDIGGSPARCCLTCNTVWTDHGDHTPVDDDNVPITQSQENKAGEALSFSDAEVDFPRSVTARGRNGNIHQQGIYFGLAPDLIALRPVTSKANVSNAVLIQIPIESVDAVLEKLTEAKKFIQWRWPNAVDE